MSSTSPPSERRPHQVDPASELEAAGERLFAAFATVAFDPGMARCTHCVSDAEVAALGDPVAKLEPALVGRFVLKAGTTWGSAADLRRVVPRALELAARGQLPVDRGLLADKLRQARWQAWPAGEAAAVRGHLLADWRRLIRAEPRAARGADTWLRHASRAGESLAPYLDDWHDALGPRTPVPHQQAAVRHLVALLSAGPLRPDVPETVYDLFPERPVAAEELAQWLTGPATAHELQRAATASSGTVDARRTALAAERLRRFHLALYQPRPDGPGVPPAPSAAPVAPASPAPPASPPRPAPSAGSAAPVGTGEPAPPAPAAAPAPPAPFG
jgi:hypothetical protein